MGRLASLAVVVFSVAACSGAPSATTNNAPMLAGDADGRTVFAARCASCHGEDLRGSDEGPSQLSIVYEPNHHSDATYRAAIRNGVGQHHWNFGDMPPVEDITDEQIERVIAYIRSEQQRLGFER